MLNLHLPKKYLKYQRVWYSGFSNIGVLGEPNICWRKNHSSLQISPVAESGIRWKMKWGKNEQLRERGRISSGRRKKLIVWSLSNASSPLLFPRESPRSPLEIFCHSRHHPARSVAARKIFSSVAISKHIAWNVVYESTCSSFEFANRNSEASKHARLKIEMVKLYPDLKIFSCRVYK